MSPRVLGLLIMALQIGALTTWKSYIIADKKHDFGVYLIGFIGISIVAFVNLMVFLKALLMITGWE